MDLQLEIIKNCDWVKVRLMVTIETVSKAAQQQSATLFSVRLVQGIKIQQKGLC